MSEKVLIYLGPTLSKEEALGIVPEAIIRPPAKQSDIISDIVQLEPTHLILIDGEFSQNLSVWIKEIIYALLFPSLEGRVYGASSMGALRAADTADWGMIGHGRIFNWYNEGVIDDDSEVALSYSVAPSGNYVQNTIPLVNIRATLQDHPNSEWRFTAASRIHWTLRTTEALAAVWNMEEAEVEITDQKRLDALSLLNSFRELEAAPRLSPNHTHISQLFLAQFDRDRRVSIQGVQTPLQHIDSHVALCSVENYRIMEDACNRSAALLLCQLLSVEVSPEEIGQAQGRFCALKALGTLLEIP